MTIATAIMALTPKVYWPLDDPTGPTADDVSGNNLFGVYFGAFALRQPGPEAGTFSALFNAAGAVRSPGQSPVIARPYAMMVFVAPASAQTVAAGLVYNGNGSVDGAGFVWGTASPVGEPCRLLHGGQGVTGDLGSLAFGSWHLVAVSESAGGNTLGWMDNVSVNNTGGNNPNPPGSSSPFQISTPTSTGSAFYAHVALFDHVLSNADVNSVWTASALVSPGSTTAIAPGDIAAIDNSLALALADLAAILAAVRRTF